MDREQKLESALRFVQADSGFRDLEPHTLVAVLNAIALATPSNTRIVTVDQLDRWRSQAWGDVYFDIGAIIGEAK